MGTLSTFNDCKAVPSEYAKAIFEAAEEGDDHMALQLLTAASRSPKVAGALADDRGRLLLHAAAEGGAVLTAVACLDAGADPNLPDPHGLTPLLLAGFGGHAEIVRELFKRGADHTARTPVDAKGGGDTLVHVAGSNLETDDPRGLEVCELALSYFDISPDLCGTSGVTALMDAAAEGAVAKARLLLAYGASVGLTDADGSTAYDRARRPLDERTRVAHDKRFREICDLLTAEASRRAA